MSNNSKVLARLVLLTVFLFLSVPARADSFNFSFTSNQTWCASFSSPCTDFGSGTITANSVTPSPVYRSGYSVTSIAGTLDGFSMSFVSQDVAPSFNGTGLSECCTGPITFMADGQQWSLVRHDTGPWFDFLYNYNSNTMEPVNLTITTPEPSSLLLMSIGLIGLVAISIRKCS